MFKPRHQASSGVRLIILVFVPWCTFREHICSLTLQFVWRARRQVLSLTHNCRGIWGDEGERVKIRWAVFLCAGQHAGSPMPSKLLSSQAERRSGIWTRASPVSAHIPKARHKWSGQLSVYSPCTSTLGEVNGQWLPAFIEPFFAEPFACSLD